jgi:hypothetical protein
MPHALLTLVAYSLLGPVVTIIPTPDDWEVRLTSGSVRFGQPHASSDDSLLRLQVGDSDAYVIFGIDWRDVAQLRHQSRTWEPSDFPALRAEWKESQRSAPRDADRLGRDESAPAKGDDSTRPLWQTPTRPGPSEPVPSPRVQYIDIDVVAANWDDDPEWDGLVVRVWPMDQSGRVVRVNGTLSVTLRGEMAYRNPVTIERLGSWVRAARAENYGPDGMNYRLEFQHRDPERWDSLGHEDHAIWPYGDVHVAFAVPGHGVFRASTTTPVRIRRFSPLRDRYYLRTGTHRLFVD